MVAGLTWSSSRSACHFSEGLVSEQERDNGAQQAAAAKANTDAQRAGAARARVNRDYTAIRSPINGVAGIAKIQIGDQLGPSTGVLATISTVNPIKVIVTLRDQHYVAYARRWGNDPAARAEHERQLELLVPERAVIELRGTHQVVVIGADNEAEIRPVTTGRRIEQRWLIEQGLKPGERIVVEGTEKARRGVIVDPRPWSAPSPSPPRR